MTTPDASSAAPSLNALIGQAAALLDSHGHPLHAQAVRQLADHAQRVTRETDRALGMAAAVAADTLALIAHTQTDATGDPR